MSEQVLPRVIWEGCIAIAQLCNKVPVTIGHQKFAPKLPLPFDDYHPNLIHPSLHRPHLPAQMASGSNEPFCHSTLSGHTHTHTHRLTDRPTDGIGERSTPLVLTLAILIASDALIMLDLPLTGSIALHCIVYIVDQAKLITIDASQSYDPDYPEDGLIFKWYCTSGKYLHLSQNILFHGYRF